jgi:hypothetical protein
VGLLDALEEAVVVVGLLVGVVAENLAAVCGQLAPLQNSRATLMCSSVAL